MMPRKTITKASLLLLRLKRSLERIGKLKYLTLSTLGPRRRGDEWVERVSLLVPSAQVTGFAALNPSDKALRRQVQFSPAALSCQRRRIRCETSESAAKMKTPATDSRISAANMRGMLRR